ncbi:hypothetical protein BO71DRAFT_481081 [Aspergillus ellipticus CBS 707.79]|uniref:Zn(2)-C6 fungal-type domain-containing protein n=1 Tax=Aspergillus ellipticus CBS 707.79 TaxID=1448320 RepID=A0A319EA64_9EURO|nr:hypothetical protein BO71DRAFT_481081 [Aspergillus ellipticus CBS 707.79]
MRKRLKVSIACDSCRSRKVKCNGAHPSCDVCTKQIDGGATCSYSRDKQITPTADPPHRDPTQTPQARLTTTPTTQPDQPQRGRSALRPTAWRIWHGYGLMDRVLSMTFCRPAMISKWLSAAVPLPLMIDDEFLDTQTQGATTRTDGQPCMLPFYISQLQLYGIINDILLELNLPEQLQIHSPLSHHNTIFRRLAIVGKVRLLHARILLFRPILSQFCLPQSHPASSPAGLQDSLTHRTVIQCSNLCLGAAHDIIELIYTNLDLTAATVLLAERIRPVIAVGITTYSNALSWTRAIEILSAYARIASQNPPDDASPHSRSWDQDFSAIHFDLDDMLWLTSVPGNL